MDIQRIEWLEPNRVCMTQGAAVALNLMFESAFDHALFLSLWDRYLGRMATLVQYNLSATSWILLFKTADGDTIRKAYLKQRSKSKKAKSSLTLQDPKRMLSEHFRIFLSRFVRESNSVSNRQGARVKHRFQKFIVNQTEDYRRAFNEMKSRIKSLEQRMERYKADEAGYKEIRGLKRKENIYQTANWFYKRKVRRHPIVDNFGIVNFFDSVLRKKITNPISENIPPFPP